MYGDQFQFVPRLVELPRNSCPVETHIKASVRINGDAAGGLREQQAVGAGQMVKLREAEIPDQP